MMRPNRLLLTLLAFPLLAGCVGGSRGGGGGDGGQLGGGDDDSAGDDDDSFGDDDTVSSEAEQVCQHWTSERSALSEGSWSGSVGSCDAGDISDQGRESALTLVNLHRWMAGLAAVSTDSGYNAAAQECALMMHAYGGLSHSPDSSWDCYSSSGADAASNSNISPTPGVEAVDLYMIDPGNTTTLGHRRWILGNNLGPIGLGSTSSYSCMWVIGGSGGPGNDWTAWPPPGPVPLDAFYLSWTDLDQTGWSVQSAAIDLGSAQVTVTADGEDLPVTITQLQDGYGGWDVTAFAFFPDGWSTEAGTTYLVEVTGISEPIEYEVEVVDCGQF